MPDSEEKKLAKSSVKLYASLEAVANSEGGQFLIKGWKQDIVASMDTLCSKYLTAPEFELRAACARLSERLASLRAIQHAGRNKKFALKELEEILKQEPEREFINQ